MSQFLKGFLCSLIFHFILFSSFFILFFRKCLSRHHSKLEREPTVHSCGDGAGEEVGEGVPPSSRSQGLVEKILEQSLKKVGGKKKTKNPQNAGAKKPRIDPPIFSRSPVKMKKVTMRGKRTKPSYLVLLMHQSIHCYHLVLLIPGHESGNLVTSL